jgi:hypothetical protein
VIKIEKINPNLQKIQLSIVDRLKILPSYSYDLHLNTSMLIDSKNFVIEYKSEFTFGKSQNSIKFNKLTSGSTLVVDTTSLGTPSCLVEFSKKSITWEHSKMLEILKKKFQNE